MHKLIELYSKFKECGVVTTDSRAIKGGELFFALKGENFDGNEYALKALEAGAAYAVVNASAEVSASDGDYFHTVYFKWLVVYQVDIPVRRTGILVLCESV